MDNINVKIILGSTRQKRFGDKPAQWIYETAMKKEGISVELLDLRDYPMPFFDDAITPSVAKGVYTNEVVAKWAKKIGEADAYIIATPEYNHGYPAVLKNAMDHVYYEWNKKPVGFVSWGTVAGARSVQQLRQVAIELQMAPIRAGIHIFSPWTLVDQQGNMQPGYFDSLKDASENFLNQLIWWAKALKVAREQNAK